MKFDCLADYHLSDVLDFLKTSKLELSSGSRRRILSGYTILQKFVRSDRPIYSINTGLGRLASVRVSPDQNVEIQTNLLRSHACAVGETSEPSVVRWLLAFRALSLGKGHSGVSLEIVQRHLDYLNKRLIPWIPQQGSVGASGDLAPLAQLGLTFIGEGYFKKSSERKKALSVLKENKLRPLKLGPKEGLALVNGTQFSLALAVDAYMRLLVFLRDAEAIASLSFEAHRATDASLDPELHAVKKHRHQQEVAARMKKMLAGSEHMQSHEGCDLVQDSYSFRCFAQVVGSCYELVDQAERLLTDEMNSVSDNPVVLHESESIVSGGHFHAHPVSLACDIVSIAVTSLCNLTERRIDQMVNPLTSRGKGFYADQPGIESGLMIIQTAAAALTSENKTLAHPASADTISTNGNQEDHVSMAPWAARKMRAIVDNYIKVTAAELVCAVRGCIQEKERSGKALSPFVEGYLREWIRRVPSLSHRGDIDFGESWRLVIENINSDIDEQLLV